MCTLVDSECRTILRRFDNLISSFKIQNYIVAESINGFKMTPRSIAFSINETNYYWSTTYLLEFALYMKSSQINLLMGAKLYLDPMNKLAP